MTEHRVSRRGFMGGLATAAGALAIGPSANLWAENIRLTPRDRELRSLMALDEYDSLAKMSFNENPWGPPESVLKAMAGAMKYANRYGYPDANIVGEIAKHHGVKPENVFIAAGSGEILDVVGSTFASNGKQVVGVEPTYAQVYQHVTSVRGSAITLPLLPDYRQDIPAMIRATKKHYRNVGFVYMCNPNNPTGRTVSKSEIKQLLDGIPEDTVVLIDEAYHHFVEDPDYATSVPYVLEGRPVIIARTFSKIAGLAGMRLGYAVAPKEIIEQMQPYSTGTINAIVKHGGVASLKDTESQATVKRMTLELRKKMTGELTSMGYAVIPSETNFFMVNLKRPMRPVIDEFRKQGVLVGRPFPPLNEHLRVSVGTAEETDRFMKAFKDIMGKPVTQAGKGGPGV
ncbi:MAG TPA: histidinol-phosphate transaminase [Gemmatimonadaceae bacterium]